VQFGFEEQNTGGRGLSDVRGRTEQQQDEGNNMRSFITLILLTKNDIMEDSITVS
jgi:hypothetical protein